MRQQNRITRRGLGAITAAVAAAAILPAAPAKAAGTTPARAARSAPPECLADLMVS